MVDGGYCEVGNYYFYIQDHLGNNRVVAKADGTVVQKNHYYPFGMEFAENSGESDQPYKYNGKELDKMHGLNMYDYSARYYEPAIGRFTTVDPLAEKYYSISPYAYVDNNPLKYIDPTGREKLNGMGTRNDGSSIVRSRYKVDNGMIHIYGHGSPEGITFTDIAGNTTSIKNANDLKYVLNRYSAIWNNRLPGEDLIIVLHSCNTADVSMANGGVTIAEKISSEMPDVTIVAPTENIWISADGEIVYNKITGQYGYWVYYKDGFAQISENGIYENNPDMKHYNRPSYTKGNTKEEQQAKRNDGLDNSKNTPKEYENWGPIRRGFYDMFGF